MHVGHVAAGLIAKRAAPEISLGTTVLAALLPDLLWCVFLLAGLEHVQLVPGSGAANYLRTMDVSYSHSILMDAVWAALFAGAYFWRRNYPRGAWVLFAAVLSHALLDIVAWARFPLSPGIPRYSGLGLWNSVPATVIVEGGLWLFAIILYLRGTHPTTRVAPFAFWTAVVVLTLAWHRNITGPPPPNAQAMALSSLIYFSLIVVWAYWINRLRPANRIC